MKKNLFNALICITLICSSAKLNSVDFNNAIQLVLQKKLPLAGLTISSLVTLYGIKKITDPQVDIKLAEESLDKFKDHQTEQSNVSSNAPSAAAMLAQMMNSNSNSVKQSDQKRKKRFSTNQLRFRFKTFIGSLNRESVEKYPKELKRTIRFGQLLSSMGLVGIGASAYFLKK